MPSTSHEGSVPGTGTGRGELAASISRAVVRLHAEQIGRGPTKARTTIDQELVVVLLHDSMTQAERSLAEAGKEAEVLRIRRAFQETMRAAMVSAVESLTDRRVVSFMSANALDPDAAAEIFVLDRAV